MLWMPVSESTKSTNNNWVDLNQGTIRFVLKHVSILHVCVSFLASRFCLIYMYKCLAEMWVSRKKMLEFQVLFEVCTNLLRKQPERQILENSEIPTIDLECAGSVPACVCPNQIRHLCIFLTMIFINQIYNWCSAIKPFAVWQLDVSKWYIFWVIR